MDAKTAAAAVMLGDPVRMMCRSYTVQHPGVPSMMCFLGYIDLREHAGNTALQAPTMKLLCSVCGNVHYQFESDVVEAWLAGRSS